MTERRSLFSDYLFRVEDEIPTTSSDAVLDADSNPAIEPKEPLRKRRASLSEFIWSPAETSSPRSEIRDSLIEWLNSASTNLVGLREAPRVDDGFKREWSYFQVRLLTEELEFGKASESEELLERLIRLHPDQTRKALNEFYIDNFANPRILSQILHVISRVQKEQLTELFQLIAVASFAKSDEIKELGVRCFESWGTPLCLKTLKGIDTDMTPWLRKYINSVIHDLESMYGVSR